jgi:RNA polymerase sigma-70 factor (ECF subfamily)
MAHPGVDDQRSSVPSEAELLVQARRGVPAALATLYGAHGGELLRLGTRLTGSRADAEDLLHDLFVGLPELLGRYEDRGNLGAWLRGVMSRLAIGRIRLDVRRVRALSKQDSAPVTESPDPIATMDVEAAIRRLADSIRVVFVLRHIEDRNYDEIASLLDISAGAARVRYLRALRQLRALMEPQS